MRDRGWVTLREFCKIADITYPTALRWAKLKQIAYVQVGGVKRVYEEEIARFIQQGTLKADPEARAELKAKREEYQRNAALKRERERN
jgi:predicted site-specific integrase-resolvase